MDKENLDVLIYILSESSNTDDSKKLWVENFKYILEISLSQVLKRKVSCEIKYYNDPLTEAKVILQIVFDKNRKVETTNKPEKVIQINCSKEQEGDSNIQQFSFYNIKKDRVDDLTSNINNIEGSVWIKLSDLSFEIKNRLRAFRKTISDNSKTFYFAETSPDQSKNRDYLIREFKHRGYTILPQTKMSDDMLVYSDQVQEKMSKSSISIHLIGDTYAPLIKNIDVSKVEMQNDIFSEVIATTNTGLKRLVLIPPGIKPRSEKQKQYIESFKRNIELHKNTEIIQTPLEDFKSIIQKRIANPAADNQLPSSEDNTKDKFIYLIKDNDNTNEISQIIESLEKAGFGVVETNRNKNKLEQIKQHQKNLVNCDGIVISYNHNNIQWLNSKLTDIIKSPGVGRKKAFNVKMLFTNNNVKKVHIKINDLEIFDINDSSSMKNAQDKISSYDS